MNETIIIRPDDPIVPIDEAPTVPEPSTVVLLVLGLLVAMGIRVRK